MRGALVSHRSLIIAAVVWLSVFGWRALNAASPQATPPAPSAGATDARATVDKYCITCHNQRLKTGSLALDAPELTNVAAHADVWEKVIR
jgi:mono/diheme cytochrome c family protein